MDSMPKRAVSQMPQLSAVIEHCLYETLSVVWLLVFDF